MCTGDRSLLKISIGLETAMAIGCSSSGLAQTQGIPQSPAGAGTVDLIMTNAHVRTTAGWSEALAIRNGIIVAVGGAAEIQALGSKGTQILDLGGETVLPGLHDVHVHPVFGGISARECSIPQGSSLKDTQTIVKACAGKARPGEWITGGQWDASALRRGAHRAKLDDG